MQSKKIPGWLSKIAGFFQEIFRWLSPGLGVKRWLGLILIGITLIALGFAVLILDIYRNAPETWWVPVLAFLSLRFLSRPLRAVIFGGLGLFMLLWGIFGLNRTLMQPFVKPGKDIFTEVSSYRKRERGPRIVVLGGGTGLSSLLRGLKLFTSNITAIVTVADDGGSSGELRKNIGVLPPGDIRNCLAALSSDETLLTQIFQYRFSNATGLNGHTLGNLLITALTDITGSFEEAVAETGRVLAVQGRVLPATLHDVQLVADVRMPDNGRVVKITGESEIPKAAGKIQHVWLEPGNPKAFPPVIQSILSADLIVIGPGSLYTSILPTLLVPDIADALRASKALNFYVCNVATQPGETEGYSCGDHVATIEKHLGRRLIDLVICNHRFEEHVPDTVEWVKIEPDLGEKYSVYSTDLIDLDNPWRHDSLKLAQAIMDLYYERTGPLPSTREGFEPFD